MEIREGYKKTDVGVIPVEWEEKKIEEVTSISIGRDLKENIFSNYTDNLHKYPVFSNTVSNRGLYGYYNTAEYEGDSLTVVGRGVGLGTAFNREGGYGAIGRLIVLFPNKSTNSNYLTEYINFKIRIYTESSGIPQLTGVSFAKYKITLPPSLTEQTAIANALSDADELIQSLEKLITKKRFIKQGAIQKLLKPKEGWVVRKLGEMADVLKGYGLSKSKLNPSGSYKCLLYGELFTTYTEVIYNIISKTNYMEGRLSIKGDILLPGSTTTKGIDLAKASALMIDDVLLGGDVIIIRNIEQSYHPSFVSHLLTHIRKFDIAQLTKGITIHHLYGRDLLDFEVSLPTNSEQTRIATILSDMDAEISALEMKLAKYKNIKQGMMQKLLTGNIRLVKGAN